MKRVGCLFCLVAATLCLKLVPSFQEIKWPELLLAVCLCCLGSCDGAPTSCILSVELSGLYIPPTNQTLSRQQYPNSLHILKYLNIPGN